MIILPNGKQYTSAAEDLALEELVNETLKELHKEITSALQSAQQGKMAMNVEFIKSALEQAYYLGRAKEAG